MSWLDPSPLKSPEKSSAGCRGVGVILRVEPDVSDDVVEPAVAVEVRRGYRGPPTGAGGGEAGLLRPVLEALALLLWKYLTLPHSRVSSRSGHPSPSTSLHKRSRDHADLAQSRRKRVGHVLEPPAAVGEEGAPGGHRIMSRQDAPADEQPQAAAVVEVRRGHRARVEAAAAARRPARAGIRRGRRSGTASAGIPGRRPAGSVAPLGHQEVLPAGARRVEQEKRPVVERRCRSTTAAESAAMKDPDAVRAGCAAGRASCRP
jgi:hypothetical protein